MKLSRLAYEAVRLSSQTSGKVLSYSDFLNGNGDTNNDCSFAVNSVFVFLNEYFQRLVTLQKIPFKVKDIGAVDGSSVSSFPISSIATDVNSVVSVFQLVSGEYVNVYFRELNRNIQLLGEWSPALDIYVQYQEDIPYLSEDDLVALEDGTDGKTVDNNIDLKEAYGITDEMCVYALEWCQGKMMEESSPSLSMIHINNVENYLNGIQDKQTAFYQNKIESKYKI